MTGDLTLDYTAGTSRIASPTNRFTVSCLLTPITYVQLKQNVECHVRTAVAVAGHRPERARHLKLDSGVKGVVYGEAEKCSVLAIRCGHDGIVFAEDEIR